MAVFRRGRATNSPNDAANSVRDAEIVTGSIPGPERSGLTPVGEDEVFGLVLVEDVVKHATARVGGKAVMVVAADTGEEWRDRSGGNAVGASNSL